MSCAFTPIQTVSQPGETGIVLAHSDRTSAADTGFGFPQAASTVGITNLPSGLTMHVTSWTPDAIILRVAPPLPPGTYQIELRVTGVGGVGACDSSARLTIATNGFAPDGLNAAARPQPAPLATDECPSSILYVQLLPAPGKPTTWDQAKYSPARLLDLKENEVPIGPVQGWGTDTLTIPLPKASDYDLTSHGLAHTVSFKPAPGSPHRVGVVLAQPVPCPQLPAVPAAKGTFRVVATGFECVKQTWDHALNVDGWADEVRVQAEVVTADFAIDPNSTPPPTTPSPPTTSSPPKHSRVRSAVFGDDSGRTQRIRAGTKTPNGGIQDGDAHGTKSVRPTDRPSSSDLPLLLWEGTLTCGKDAVAIVPMLWEVDDTTDPSLTEPMWESTVPTLLASSALSLTNPVRSRLDLPQLPPPPIAWGAGGNLFAPQLKPEHTLAGAQDCIVLAGGSPGDIRRDATDFLGRPGDRPIGMFSGPAGKESARPFVLVLTYELATLLAQTPPISAMLPPPIDPWLLPAPLTPLTRTTEKGTITFPFADGGNVGLGSYFLFVQVQKVATSPP